MTKVAAEMSLNALSLILFKVLTVIAKGVITIYGMLLVIATFKKLQEMNKGTC